MAIESTVPESLLALTQGYRVAIRKAVHAKELGLNAMLVHCLHIIQDSPQCTANTIVQRMGRDKAQIARLVKEMITTGLVYKHPNPDDKRSQLLRLTEEGQCLMTQITAAEALIDKQMRQGLKEEDVQTFQRVALVMAQNLKNAD